jgi:hypothetical protein
MYNSTPKALVEKWAPILNEGESIQDKHKKAVTAQLLENTERMIREERGMLTETPNTVGALPGALGTSTTAGLPGLPGEVGGLAGFDPILIGLVRRSMPNLMAYDICGVQPMSGPTGLIFAMKSKYQARDGAEALFNEPDVNFSATAPATETGAQASPYQSGEADYVYDLTTNTGDNIDPLGSVQSQNPANRPANPGVLNDGGTYEGGATAARGIGRDDAEKLGAGPFFNEMSFSIEKTSVFARTRALKAEYTLELAQDLRAIHGLDAEGELANLLSSEILAEINREVVRTVYTIAKPGAQNNVANTGIFDLDVDSNGRWSVEKWKGLMFQMERDANAIAQETRRGKGNFMITSADVASAMAMAGVLDYTSGLNGAGGPGIGEVDDTGNLRVGTMNGRIAVYIDPYSANIADSHYYVMGYKGSSPYDAGLFYCPYVPLQQLRSIDPNTFQPKIAFKTRYGMVANPFVETSPGVPDQDALTANKNQYYRRVTIKNLM